MRRITAAIPLLLSIVLAACTFTPPQAPSATGTGATAGQDLLSITPFTSANPKITLTPPRGWRVDGSGNMGTIVVFQNPSADVEAKSAFAANVYVIQEETANMSFADYIQSNRTSMKTYNQHFTSTDDHALTVSGQSAQILEGTFTQDEFTLRTRQLIIVKDKIAYVIGATALASKWEKYKAAFDAVLGSVQF